MQDGTKQRWEQLCEQAATEQDPQKFFALIKEINRLLEERRMGLTYKNQRARPESMDPTPDTT